MNLRDALQAIYDENRTISPRLVVDTAREPGHPLHPRFEWDDSVAGERFRLVQAQTLIRSIRIVYKTHKHTGVKGRVRAYVSTAEHATPSEYLATEDAMSDSFTRQLILRQFERARTALWNQFGHLKEYSEMVRKHALREQEDVA